MAIFADVVRKILILQTTKPLWTSDAAKWKGDIKEIAKCSAAQFEQLSAILAKHGQQSMQEMMHANSAGDASLLGQTPLHPSDDSYR